MKKSGGTLKKGEYLLILFQKYISEKPGILNVEGVGTHLVK